MEIKKITSVVFSPTESTKNILSIFTEKFPLKAEEMNVTLFAQKDLSRTFASDELVIFGAPVYGGRIPAPAMQRFNNMRGNNTPAVLIVVFGNRAYDDALLELKHGAEKNGFLPIAAGAFIAEHSIVHSVAHGRPDEKDRQALLDFAGRVWWKLEKLDAVDKFSNVAVSGEMPFRKYDGIPLKPKGHGGCTKCGVCVDNCPVQAISREAPTETDKTRCISCMRCVKLCPAKTRKLGWFTLMMANKLLAHKWHARLEPELFI